MFLPQLDVSGVQSAFQNLGQVEAERQRRKEAERSRRFQTIGMIGGAVVGGFVGGPSGAVFGANLGRTLGGAQAGDTPDPMQTLSLGLQAYSMSQQEAQTESEQDILAAEAEARQTGEPTESVRPGATDSGAGANTDRTRNPLGINQGQNPGQEIRDFAFPQEARAQGREVDRLQSPEEVAANEQAIRAEGKEAQLLEIAANSPNPQRSLQLINQLRAARGFGPVESMDMPDGAKLFFQRGPQGSVQPIHTSRGPTKTFSRRERRDGRWVQVTTDNQGNESIQEIDTGTLVAEDTARAKQAMDFYLATNPDATTDDLIAAARDAGVSSDLVDFGTIASESRTRMQDANERERVLQQRDVQGRVQEFIRLNPEVLDDPEGAKRVSEVLTEEDRELGINTAGIIRQEMLEADKERARVREAEWAQNEPDLGKILVAGSAGNPVEASAAFKRELDAAGGLAFLEKLSPEQQARLLAVQRNISDREMTAAERERVQANFESTQRLQRERIRQADQQFSQQQARLDNRERRQELLAREERGGDEFLTQLQAVTARGIVEDRTARNGRRFTTLEERINSGNQFIASASQDPTLRLNTQQVREMRTHMNGLIDKLAREEDRAAAQANADRNFKLAEDRLAIAKTEAERAQQARSNASQFRVINWLNDNKTSAINAVRTRLQSMDDTFPPPPEQVAEMERNAEREGLENALRIRETPDDLRQAIVNRYQEIIAPDVALNIARAKQLYASGQPITEDNVDDAAQDVIDAMKANPELGGAGLRWMDEARWKPVIRARLLQAEQAPSAPATAAGEEGQPFQAPDGFSEGADLFTALGLEERDNNVSGSRGTSPVLSAVGRAIDPDKEGRARREVLDIALKGRNASNKTRVLREAMQAAEDSDQLDATDEDLQAQVFSILFPNFDGSAASRDRILQRAFVNRNMRSNPALANATDQELQQVTAGTLQVSELRERIAARQ